MQCVPEILLKPAGKAYPGFIVFIISIYFISASPGLNFRATSVRSLVSRSRSEILDIKAPGNTLHQLIKHKRDPYPFQNEYEVQKPLNADCTLTVLANTEECSQK